jgi:hypothetical protein
LKQYNNNKEKRKMQIGIKDHESCPLRSTLGSCTIGFGAKVSSINGCNMPYNDDTFEYEVGFPAGCPLLKKDVVIGIIK